MTADSGEGAGGEELKERLRRVLKDALQVETLPEGEDLRRRDIAAWDSISHLRLMLEVEQEFDTSLDDEAFVLADSLRKIEELLRGQGIGG
ncbi:MAG: acyl carrier protein [Steroidobacteraceae bacterium]